MPELQLQERSTTASGALVARPLRFDDIPRAVWDRLYAATPAATPFSRWTIQRAWWDAYGSTAHDHHLACYPASDADPGPDSIRAIIPLMHRHVVEAEDEATATALRRRSLLGRRVRPDAKAVYFGASYHADYATVLADPSDVPAVAAAFVEALTGPPDPEHGPQDWDVVDLRRFRDGDLVLDALERAFRAAADQRGWDVCREQEDVCPVADLGADDWEGYLGRLGKKARHEIRRKMRRAESFGEIPFRLLEPTRDAVDTFIELHQARWGAEGLFPPTAGGDRSRTFLHRMAELEAAEGDGRQLQFGRVEIGDRIVFATVGFDDGETCFFYNAGMEPAAREMSPGVTGTAAYIRDRLAAGRRRFDFLRGDEPYKYEWGAVDEPIHRLLVSRAEGSVDDA